MAGAIKSKIVRVGNSYGIRIPKVLLEQLDFGSDVELVIEGNKLIVRAATVRRAHWEAQFALMHASGDDQLLDDAVPTRTGWDAEEWEW